MRTPEKVREYNQAYYRKHRPRLLADMKARRDSDPEDNRDRCREWGRKNAQYKRDKAREYRVENREAVLQKKREWYQKNKARHHELGKAWKKRNPDKTWEYTLRNAYGIGAAEWQAMFAAQGGACAICQRKVKRLCVDHCHDSGQVRGLLCQLCNSAIGKLQDSPVLLRRAIAYLATHHGPSYLGRAPAVAA